MRLMLPAIVGQDGGVLTLATTPVLDWAHPQVARLAAEVQESDPRTALIAAHRLIAARLRPVYALDEFQPVSVTLALSKGSCSQRLAVLEAVARARGIATRVRGLQVDGRFWAARFPRLRALLPPRPFRHQGRVVRPILRASPARRPDLRGSPAGARVVGGTVPGRPAARPLSSPNSLRGARRTTSRAGGGGGADPGAAAVRDLAVGGDGELVARGQRPSGSGWRPR